MPYAKHEDSRDQIEVPSTVGKQNYYRSMENQHASHVIFCKDWSWVQYILCHMNVLTTSSPFRSCQWLHGDETISPLLHSQASYQEMPSYPVPKHIDCLTFFSRTRTRVRLRSFYNEKSWNAS